MTWDAFVQMLWMGVGGFLGTCLRFVVGSFVQRGIGSLAFPVGTLTVNLLGCFGIGLVAALAQARADEPSGVHLFLMVGVLGGFTTYSAFANESLSLFRGGSPGWGFLHLGLHIGAGLIAVMLGFGVARWWLPVG